MSNKKAYKIEIMGFLIYVVFVALAMIFYAGGTQMDPSAPGYTFWFNTISDSGRLYARSGKPNFISFVFFAIAYCTIALSMIPFYLVFPRLFDENSLEKKITKIAVYFGIISSIGFIGVVPTPADVLYVPHMIFAILAYVAMLIVMVIYSFAIYRSSKFSKQYMYTFIIFTLLFLVFLLMALTSLTLGIRELLTIGQKIGRASLLIGFTTLTIGAWKLE
ncbi:MAG: hypothetical protein EU539_04790 [Promethearchaeota archaeon]|nr:MAG: hypothetical protein EU539_04790 [Candidatus Lokiarchaeota archaeon]